MYRTLLGRGAESWFGILAAVFTIRFGLRMTAALVSTSLSPRLLLRGFQRGVSFAAANGVSRLIASADFAFVDARTDTRLTVPPLPRSTAQP